MMQHEEWYIEGCVKASPEEWALYREWTGHLPVREESTPYHSGPHSIKNFRHAFAIAELKSPTVLEVGFCLGHSAEIMLRIGATHVTSIEISNRKQTIDGSLAMAAKWPGRHWMFHPDDLDGKIGRYDFGFIDGDHGAEAICKDVGLMRHAKVDWVLFDDFWPHWGDTQIVMKEQGICPVAILGTMALCKF